jgi:hypothetical protein
MTASVVRKAWKGRKKIGADERIFYRYAQPRTQAPC